MVMVQALVWRSLQLLRNFFQQVSVACFKNQSSFLYYYPCNVQPALGYVDGLSILSLIKD
jgi:hypothetical protein